MSARASTPDAKGVRAGKKPRGPSTQDIHKQTTVKHQTGPSREEPKRKGVITKAHGRQRSGRTSMGALRGTSRTGPRQGREGRERTQTRGQTPEKIVNRDKERLRERVFLTLQGGEEREKNSRPSQKGNPLTAGPA